MQKVKEIFSSHSDERTSADTGRASTGSNYANTGNSTSTHGATSEQQHSDMPKSWALGALGSSGHDSTSTGRTGDGLNTTSGHSSSSPLASGTHGSSVQGSNAGVGERGIGRDAVAGSTGHGTMSHGQSANTTSGTTGHQSLSEKLTGGHTFGHDNRTDNKFDPTGENTTHDHKHLQGVTHATHRHIEVEEVERQREQHRHVHHVQHHVQPVVDTQVKDEVHHQNVVPVTKISEKHANTEEDVKLFHSLGEKHRNEEKHLPKERTVVDLGEKVNEITHHHVHHVTQPVVEQEVHDKHRIHTVIPLTHTVHEAPIIHKSSHHEPVHMADFLKGGGKLDSGITHKNTDILSTGECDRTVDGVGEKLAQDLNLRTSTHGSHNPSTGSNYTQSANSGSGIGSGLTGSHSGATGSHSSGLTGTGAHSGLTGTNTGNSGVSGQSNRDFSGSLASSGLSGDQHRDNLTGNHGVKSTSGTSSGHLPPGTGPGTTGVPAR